MARGWESKSIETQQEEAAQAKAARDTRGSAPGELEAASRRRTLELARAKVESELRRARVPAHREMLQQALDDLDRQLTGRSSG